MKRASSSMESLDDADGSLMAAHSPAKRRRQLKRETTREWLSAHLRSTRFAHLDQSDIDVVTDSQGRSLPERLLVERKALSEGGRVGSTVLQAIVDEFRPVTDLLTELPCDLESDGAVKNVVLLRKLADMDKHPRLAEDVGSMIRDLTDVTQAEWVNCARKITSNVKISKMSRESLLCDMLRAQERLGLDRKFDKLVAVAMFGHYDMAVTAMYLRMKDGGISQERFCRTHAQLAWHIMDQEKAQTLMKAKAQTGHSKVAEEIDHLTGEDAPRLSRAMFGSMRQNVSFETIVDDVKGVLHGMMRSPHLTVCVLEATRKDIENRLRAESFLVWPRAWTFYFGDLEIAYKCTLLQCSQWCVDFAVKTMMLNKLGPGGLVRTLLDDVLHATCSDPNTESAVDADAAEKYNLARELIADILAADTSINSLTMMVKALQKKTFPISSPLMAALLSRFTMLKSLGLSACLH